MFDSDAPELERLVRLEIVASKLLQEIASQGAVYQDKNGDERRSPSVMAYGNISAEIGNIRKLLALGPAYRNKLPGNEPVRPGEIPPALAEELKGLLDFASDEQFYRTGELYGIPKKTLDDFRIRNKWAIT